MTRVIECIIGALLISVFGPHHANQDTVDFMLEYGQAERVPYVVDGDELIHLTELEAGEEYFVHISSFSRDQIQIQHSDVRRSPSDRTTPERSTLPISIEFRTSSDEAWFRLYSKLKQEPSFSLLKQSAKKGDSRAAGIVVDPGYSTNQLMEDVYRSTGSDIPTREM